MMGRGRFEGQSVLSGGFALASVSGMMSLEV